MGPFVLKVTSDFVEALPLVGVWKSATTMPGAQCVMISGVVQMPELSVDSWDFLTQVSNTDANGVICQYFLLKILYTKCRKMIN